MSRTTRPGLSLIEVCVVLFILMILIGLFLPATRRVHDAAARTYCINNLKQIMLGIQNYSDTYSVLTSAEQSVITPSPVPTGCIGPGMIPEQRLSWYVAILPYLEQDALYRQFDREKNYAGNQKAAETAVKIFCCPAIVSATPEKPALLPITTYVAAAGTGTDAATRPAGKPGNGFMGYDRTISLNAITDGTSNTIGVLESHLMVGPWAQGGPATLRSFENSRWHDPAQPIGQHVPGPMVAFADGSVRSISYAIDPVMLAAMFTIAGGETVTFE